jgi:hypothetical protein
MTLSVNRSWFKALRSVVEAAEDHLNETGETWSDFGDSDVPLWRWGSEKAQQLDDTDARFTAVLQSAVKSNGASLADDLAALLAEIPNLPKTDLAWAARVIALAKRRAESPASSAVLPACVAVIFVYVDSDQFWHHVRSGRMAAPRVDATAFDYHSFQKEISSLLGQTVRVPDDLMDGTTIHMRHLGHFPGPPDGADFWRALLAASADHDSPVIPVMRQWQRLHAEAVRDRSAAPPPQMFPVVIEAADGTQLLHRVIHIRHALGIVDDSGDCHMPTPLRDYLTRKFQLPWKPFVNVLIVPNAPAKAFLGAAMGRSSAHF